MTAFKPTEGNPLSEPSEAAKRTEASLTFAKPMGRPFKLRPYQKAAVHSVVSRYKDENERRMLLYLPTGAGKTVIATFIIKALCAYSGFGKYFSSHTVEKSWIRQLEP